MEFYSRSKYFEICRCTGLTCDEIHFTPGLGGDPVHQAELLLLGHGYGICTSTPGQVFG